MAKKTTPIKDRLRAWRVENKLSRPAVAELLNVSPRTVEAWEQGRAEIPKRAEGQILAVMEGTDFLEIPLSQELKDKVRKLKAAGHDPQKWAAEMLGKMILCAAALFALWHFLPASRPAIREAGNLITTAAKSAAAYVAKL